MLRSGYRARGTEMYDAHPAIAAPMRLRIDYARVVASVAGVDASVGDEEAASLRGLCGALGLPPGATEGVLLFADAPTPDRVRESVEALRDSDLRTTLIIDLVAIAMADGKYHIAERKQIHAIAALLLVPEKELSAIEDYVAQSLSSGEIVTESPVEHRPAVVAFGGEIAGSLAAAGVPLAVVWAVSPRGLSMSGVTKALDVLGFGLGPLAGVLVDVSLGVLAYTATRILFRIMVGER